MWLVWFAGFLKFSIWLLNLVEVLFVLHPFLFAHISFCTKNFRSFVWYFDWFNCLWLHINYLFILFFNSCIKIVFDHLCARVFSLGFEAMPPSPMYPLSVVQVYGRSNSSKQRIKLDLLLRQIWSVSLGHFRYPSMIYVIYITYSTYHLFAGFWDSSVGLNSLYNMFLVHFPSHFVTIQIPGFKGMQNTTVTILTHLKGFGQKLANSVLVDEEHFPKHSQRFTAVYSRDKEYL